MISLGHYYTNAVPCPHTYTQSAEFQWSPDGLLVYVLPVGEFQSSPEGLLVYVLPLRDLFCCRR